MDPSRFDALTKALGGRRSRRAALKGGGAGFAALALGAAGLRSGAAQEATPAAGEASLVVGAPPPGATADAVHKTFFLFVQSFQGGDLTPLAAPADGGATHTLTLSEGLGQTIFFADRPNRTVGAVPTQQFLDGLGFSPANPPNAALVADLGGGDEEILVVELLNPRYEEATHTATYDVAILADHERVDLEFRSEPHAGGDHPGATYGASQLFIDDCSDDDVDCLFDTSLGQGIARYWENTGRSVGPVGFCYSWWDPIGCFPCRDYGSICNQEHPDVCQGHCGTMHL